MKKNLDALTWKVELRKEASKFHLIGAWFAVIFNPIFGIADFYNINHHWKTLFVVRMVIALLTLTGILLYKKKKIDVNILVFIPFLGIALQNMYIYSVITVPEHFQQHSFASLAVFFAAGLFVLWERKYTIIIMCSYLLAGGLATYFNELNSQAITLNGGMLTDFVALLTVFVIDRRYKSVKEAVIARLELEEQTKIVEQKNRQITKSIQYAKRIQEAILPHTTNLKTYFTDYFILFMPRDIVSGDFYWCEKKNDKIILALADCTGHGVPGAFMSMIGNSLLREVVLEKNITEPAKILNSLRQGVINSLRQSGKTGEAQDGMDISLCTIDYENKVMEFSGAFNSLLHIRQNEITLIKGDKQPIGIYRKTTDFTNHRIEIQEGDLIYLFTDGYQDQFGGAANQKFTSKRLRKLIMDIKEQSMQAQEQSLKQNFLDWKASQQQIDDVSLVGFRV